MKHLLLDVNNGSKHTSDSGLTALQRLKHLAGSPPRMLTASEIKLLRQSKVEIQQRVCTLIRLKAEQSMSGSEKPYSTYRSTL